MKKKAPKAGGRLQILLKRMRAYMLLRLEKNILELLGDLNLKIRGKDEDKACGIQGAAFPFPPRLFSVR